MFKGTYHHKIDGKGRVPVPAPFRHELQASKSAGLVATLVDECIAVYPESEWRRLTGQLRSLPPFSRQGKALARHLASRAVDCALDSQGRILLPALLRAAAGLSREAVVVGVVDRIEVWAPEPWARFLRESERLLEDVSLGLSWPIPTPAADPVSPPRSTGKP